MSEVIVRMEKVPKNCDDSCWGYLSGECPWSGHVDGYRMDCGRPRNCPIIGVLPEQHGDLIDRDAFISTIRPLCEEDKFSACTFETVKRLMVKHINNAPAIVPADTAERMKMANDQHDKLVEHLAAMERSVL